MDDDCKFLLICKDEKLILRLGSLLEKHSSPFLVDSLEMAMDVIDRMHIDFIIMQSNMALPEKTAHFNSIRHAQLNKKCQIILILEPDHLSLLEDLPAQAIDDFIMHPFNEHEFRARLCLAMIRRKLHEHLSGELDFYKHAVKQEEEFSSKLLDRQLFLKETLEDARYKRKLLQSENRRLTKEAGHDVLTGLLNRRSLNARLEHELSRAHTEIVAVSGMMIDIDDFKRVNDSYGHLAGDEILKCLGALMQVHLRKNDYAGRFGGEEFFIILPETELDAAVAIAERIRDAVENRGILWLESEIQVTISMGVSQIEDGDSIAEWVGRCDAAMYRAKQLGKNRVET